MKRTYFVFSVLFLAYCACTIRTASPSVSFGDSGEFSAAAETLSIPHAPSYPLFSLAGKTAIGSIPFANKAYRVNLVSALSGAAAAAFLYLLALQCGLSLFSSIAVSSTFAFSNLLWENTAAAEVFTMNAFFAILIFWCLSLDKERHSFFSRAAGASFLFGLGMGDHHTLVLVVPAAAVLCMAELRGTSAGWGEAVRKMVLAFPLFLLFCLAGLSVYLYLPIRSLKDPPIDWSNPETFRNFWRVITRQDYGSFALAIGEKIPRNLHTSLGQVRRFLDAAAGGLTWIGVSAGLLGWFFWFRRSKGAALSYLVFFAVSGIGFLLLGNMPFDAQSNGILGRFFLLPAIPLVLALGFFLDSFGARFGRTVYLGALLPVFLFWNAHGHRTFSRNDFAPYDYGRNILKTLPRDAVLFMDGGDDTFYTLAYLTMAEAKRRDLKLHDRGGLIYTNPYGDDFRKISKPEKEERRRSVESSFLGVRPLYYSTFDKRVLPGTELVQRGILYEALPPRSAPRNKFPWEVYSMRGVYETLDRPYRLRALLPLYPFLEGLDKGCDLRWMRRASGFGKDIVWLGGNIAWQLSLKAYALTQENKTSEAEQLYRFIVDVKPDFASAYSNLGVLMEKSGKIQEAESLYLKAVKADPSYADAYFNLGSFYWKQSRWKEVVSMFEKTVELDPRHPTAQRYLDVARMKLMGGAQ